MIKKIYKKIEENKIYFILFIITLAIISSLNIFHKGMIYGDDINFHIHRILSITDNIKIGKNVPVYFNYLNGFGYANGLFYPDHFLIIPALLNYIGINIITSLKIFIVIINIIAIYTMYICVYKISKEKKCGYISMILYALSNYRLIDFIRRGALGEMLAFIFIPLVILGLYEILYDNEKKGYYLTIGISCLCFSHVISFYLMTCLTILIILMNIKCLKEKQRLKSLIINISLAVLITSHFWLPMLEQLIKYEFKLNTNTRIFENIIPLYLIFIDLPIDKYSEYYPAGIGLIYYLTIITNIKILKKNKFLKTLILLGILCIIPICVGIIWKIDIFYKLFSIIQFPWRLYMYSTVLFIITFSVMIKHIKINNKIILCVIYTLIMFITNVAIGTINMYIYKPQTDEIMLGEYLPKKFNLEYIDNYKNEKIEYKKENNILNITIKKETDNIEIPLIYYEGYKACDEKCYETYQTNEGLVGIKIDSETKKIKVWYDGTKLYNITKYISGISILLLIYKIKKYDQ